MPLSRKLEGSKAITLSSVFRIAIGKHKNSFDTDCLHGLTVWKVKIDRRKFLKIMAFSVFSTETLRVKAAYAEVHLTTSQLSDGDHFSVLSNVASPLRCGIKINQKNSW